MVDNLSCKVKKSSLLMKVVLQSRVPLPSRVAAHHAEARRVATGSSSRRPPRKLAPANGFPTMTRGFLNRVHKFESCRGHPAFLRRRAETVPRGPRSPRSIRQDEGDGRTNAPRSSTPQPERPMTTGSAKLVVVAAVREVLFNLPRSAGTVVVGRKQRQIMAGAFDYIDVQKVTDEELLGQLRSEIATTLRRLDAKELGQLVGRRRQHLRQPHEPDRGDPLPCRTRRPRGRREEPRRPLYVVTMSFAMQKGQIDVAECVPLSSFRRVRSHTSRVR